jgi:hypothetical protein
MTKNRKELIYSVVAITAVAIFPAIFLYTYNADEVDFFETLESMFLFVGIGIVIAGIGCLFTKSSTKGALISILFMLVLINYALLERGVQSLLPPLRYWHILPTFVFILLHIFYLIHKKMPFEVSKDITKIICIVFMGLILVNTVSASPVIANKINQKKISQLDNNENLSNYQITNETNPNIYLLIFDEYASFNMIKKCYDYDNSQFASFLNSKGFTVSMNSHNESLITSTVTTNLVNLEYIVDNTTLESEKEGKRHSGKLFSILNGNGYTIKGVGFASWYGLEDSLDGESVSGAQTIGGETFRDILLQRTAVYPFTRPNISAYAQMLNDSIDYFNQNSNFSKNEFIILHLLSPHTPFAVDANGNAVPYDHYMDWEDKQYYLGQYIYVTKLMTQLVESIIKNDPDSIIILQSDHGARASKNPNYFVPRFDLDDMNGILNAVYYRGEPISEIEGQSGVNTLRIVLNMLLDSGLELVEVPKDEYQY